jgi:hypothetical protein
VCAGSCAGAGRLPLHAARYRCATSALGVPCRRVHATSVMEFGKGLSAVRARAAGSVLGPASTVPGARHQCLLAGWCRSECGLTCVPFPHPRFPRPPAPPLPRAVHQAESLPDSHSLHLTLSANQQRSWAGGPPRPSAAPRTLARAPLSPGLPRLLCLFLPILDRNTYTMPVHGFRPTNNDCGRRPPPHTHTRPPPTHTRAPSVSGGGAARGAAPGGSGQQRPTPHPAPRLL